MSENLAVAQKAEEDRKANHAGLIAAKEEEIATLTSTIQTKLTRQGNLAVEVESLKNHIAHTQRSLAADQELAAKLAGSCGSQSSEWEERRKSRAEDDALELFKATLPSPSLMQVQRSTVVLAKRAFDELRRSPTAPQNSASNLKLIALALSGKSVLFHQGHLHDRGDGGFAEGGAGCRGQQESVLLGEFRQDGRREGAREDDCGS